MRYRKLDANGDYSFGAGQSNFFINVPAAVGQAVKTRLLLFEGEWFLDLTEGTPWFQQILGKSVKSVADQMIQSRILGTQGVTRLDHYESRVTPQREFIVGATITTLYGVTEIAVVLTIPPE